MTDLEKKIDKIIEKEQQYQFNVEGAYFEMDNLKEDMINLIKQEIAIELRKIRSEYDRLELLQNNTATPDEEMVDWRGWKMIRNVITDRIEELTGSRQ